jgi:hypothetical protein
VLNAIFHLLDYRLLRWRLSGKEVEGDRIWKNLRRFTAWTFIGDVAAIVSLSLLLQGRNFTYESVDAKISRREFYELRAKTDRYFSAFNIFYPLHLLCVFFAFNMLLRRVSDHASHSYYNTARDQHNPKGKPFDCRDCVGQYALYYMVRYLHKIVMIICALNAAARVVAAAFRAETAQFLDQAGAATDAAGRETDLSRTMNANSVAISFRNANTAIALTQVLEAAAFLIVALAFLLFFPIIIVMFRRVERRMDGVLREMQHRKSDNGNVCLPFEFSPRAADGSDTQIEMGIVEAKLFLKSIKASASAQRKRFLVCLVISLAALAVHAFLAVFVALLGLTATPNPECADLSCDSCQNVGMLMLVFHLFTPEYLQLVVALCTSLPLTFSLWMMTSKADRALLVNPGKFLSDGIRSHSIRTENEVRLNAERNRMGINLQ